jgi:hypothetical protein
VPAKATGTDNTTPICQSGSPQNRNPSRRPAGWQLIGCRGSSKLAVPAETGFAGSVVPGAMAD